MEQEYFSEKEVAQKTGLSIKTLQNHRATGTGLPFFRIGRTVRYGSEDIKEYMNEHRVEPCR